MNEDNVQKNISQLAKSMKQLETDVKNAQQDKSAPENDKFVPVMSISFSPAFTSLFVLTIDFVLDIRELSKSPPMNTILLLLSTCTSQLAV